MLLLKLSRVGVSRESMEKEDEDRLGDEGDTREDGRSLSLCGAPRGSDGDGRRRSLGLATSGRCVCERASGGGLGELCGEGLQWNRGLEGLWRSMLGARLLRGLTVFMYISISSARSLRAAGARLASPSCSVSAASRDRGSEPLWTPVLATGPPLQLTLLSMDAPLGFTTAPVQLTLLSTAGFCLSPLPSASPSPPLHPLTPPSIPLLPLTLGVECQDRKSTRLNSSH